ncbi:OmpH family outer membrane protein [Pontixanthobacter aquaemixtae]|uniref:OmpH family outer membrane protein n=1 Tax=Pontixanthobacter aquaemixtae TaxID=1958940 RepID=A0A844ZSR1_9SPHN|nr:OmpH family outer membrane protein [Pontixanthobacter aquaemixtae]MXO89837.1 OmpH family outer membrane protein [Pontixanthobacter aquaemixtae]
MKTFLKTLAAASLATAAMSAAPATAQVSGKIAVISPTEVVLSTTALQNAYQQINTTYATQRTTLAERTQQYQTLLQQLDTNGDGQLDEAEQRAASQNAAQVQQAQQLEQEIAQLSNQIERVRIYAVEQVLTQYNPALQQVIQQQQVQVVLNPNSVTYAAPDANIGDEVTAIINTTLPVASITPPQDWRPLRASVAMFQNVQEALLAVAQQQAVAAAAQQQQQPAQPTQPPAPTGR